MRKKIIVLMMALVFVFSFTACGVEIADTNGPDDYSLATITDENIINQDLGASTYSTSPGMDSEDYMTSSTKVKGKEFSGVVELYGTNLLGKSDITIDLSSIAVNEGNFRLVVLQDDEIVHEFNNEEILQTCELKDVNGHISVVMAGETASFKFYVQVW